MEEKKYVRIPTETLQIVEKLSDEEVGHVLNLIYDYWNALDKVDAEKEFEGEPALKAAWPELKELIEFGEEEAGEADAEPAD